MEPKLFSSLIVAFSLLISVSAEPRFIPGRSKNLSPNALTYPWQLSGLSNFRSLEEATTIKSSTSKVVTTRLKGNSELGYYYVTLFFGIPIQKQTLIVDTGSVTTTIPCSECGDNCGKKHFNSPFNHSNSNSFQDFGCNEQFGDYVCRDCSSNCSFGVSYVEGSSYSGEFKKDYVTFGNELEDNYARLTGNDTNTNSSSNDTQTSNNDTQSSNNTQNATAGELDLATLKKIIDERKIFMPFGCTTKETKLFYDQQADGILGLGVDTNTYSSPPNLMDAMEIDNTSYSKVFSLCFAHDGGYLSFGGYNLAYHEPNNSVFYTEFFHEYGQYRVFLNKIEMEGEPLALTPKDLNHGEGAFFDSGTTYTHVPAETYNALINNMRDFCGKDSKNCAGVPMEKPKKMFCWNMTNIDLSNETAYTSTFPSFKVYFGQDGDAEYNWRPEDYLFHKTLNSTPYLCWGLQQYQRETILGGTFMRNHDVLFDKLNKRIGFTTANCSAVLDITVPRYEAVELTPPEHEDAKAKPEAEPANKANMTASNVTEDEKSKNEAEPQNKSGTESKNPNKSIRAGKTDSTVKDDSLMMVILLFLVGGVIIFLTCFLCKPKKRSSYGDMANEIEIPTSASKLTTKRTELYTQDSPTAKQDELPASSRDIADEQLHDSSDMDV